MKNSFLKIRGPIISLLLIFELQSSGWTTTCHFFSDSFKNNQQSIVVDKVMQQPFNQLLISWNGSLPARGYFRFFLEVFDEKLKKWSRYTMYEWGAGVSRSLITKDKNSGAEYVHVRFEGAAGRKYHQFRVHIEALQGADINQIRSISVCASDLSLYASESFEHSSKNSKLVRVAGVPTLSQHIPEYPESSGWCSPASLAQVIEFYTKKPVNLPKLAGEVFDSNLNAYGSWPFNTAQAGVYLPDYICYVTRLSSLKEVIKLLKAGYPVIVSICSSVQLPGAPKAYDKGHLITIVGIDMRKREIICHDTAEKDVTDAVKHYPIKPFIQAWENRYRLAYVIRPRTT